MSRWTNSANQHPFKKSWEVLLITVQELAIDESTSAGTVEELARLKKVLSFLGSIIDNLDAELMPLAIYSTCHQYSENCRHEINQYKGTQNSGYLVNANEYADMLIAQLRPYLVIPEQYIKAYGIAQKSYIEQFDDYILSLEQAAKKAQSSLSIASGLCCINRP